MRQHNKHVLARVERAHMLPGERREVAISVDRVLASREAEERALIRRRADALQRVRERGALRLGQGREARRTQLGDVVRRVACKEYK